MSNVADKLWLPNEMQPKYGCFMCGALFMEHEVKKYDEHVVKCSEENEDIVMGEMSVREKMKPILEVGDHELDAYVKKHKQDYITGKKRL